VGGREATPTGVIELSFASRLRARGPRRSMAEKGRCARTSSEARAQHGDNIGRRNFPTRKHTLESTGCEVPCNIPLRPDRDTLPCDCPLAYQRPVIAAHGGTNADGLRLAGRMQEAPQGDVLVVLSDHEASMPNQV
jgi:hypothetical protein